MRATFNAACAFVTLMANVSFAADASAPASDAKQTSASKASLENWAQWRGPLANGVAPLGDPPTHWDENTNIKWKVKIPGHSTASPIVWGNKVFLISAIETDRPGEPEPSPPIEPATTSAKVEGPANADEKKADEKKAEDEAKPPAPRPRGMRLGGGSKKPTTFYQFVVLAVDRQSGKTLWQDIAKEAVPHEGHHPDGSFASASPMTDGKRVYASFGSRGVYAYDMDGKRLWNRDLGRMIIFNTFGEGSSPVVHGDSLIVNWDHQDGSCIYCLDAATGVTKWKVDRDENTTWATPLIVDANGRTQVIVHGSTRVRSYDLKTGELIWACGGQGPSAIPCPVTDGQQVYAMTGFITNSLIAIPLDSIGDITGVEGKVAWKRRQPGTPYVPSPILYDGLLYFTASNKGLLSCIDAKTGEPIVDRQRLDDVANIYASPVGAADRIYFTSREGNTVVIKRGGFEKTDEAAKNQAVILATNKLDDHFDASPAIVGHEILLHGNEHLYCISSDK